MSDDDASRVEAWLGAAPELRQVLPLALDLGFRAGRRIILPSAEIWSGGILLHVVEIPAPTGADLPPRERWELSDDRGTEYQQTDMRSVDGDTIRWRSRWRFVPAPPTDATTLTLRFRDPDGLLVVDETVNLAD